MRHVNSKTNKYLKESLHEAELDFHGLGILNEGEIRNTAENFIEDCVVKNIKKALIITGKGLHSRNKKAVVKPVIVDLLKQNKRIKSFYEARIDRGQDGAFEIILY